MSEPIEPAGNPGGLQHRTFGLPMWGWIAIATAGGLAVILYLRNRSAKAAATTDPSADTSFDATDNTIGQDQYEQLLAQVRDLQGEASTPGPAGPAGPVGPIGATGATGVNGTVTTPKPTTPPSAARKFVTVVKYTDKNPSELSTLSGIVNYAKAHGVTTTVAKLRTLNHLTASTAIHPGQKIYYT